MRNEVIGALRRGSLAAAISGTWHNRRAGIDLGLNGV
jgi:hypothetical protein